MERGVQQGPHLERFLLKTLAKWQEDYYHKVAERLDLLKKRIKTLKVCKHLYFKD